MTTTLTIAGAFHGPPASGNGGYVCGCLARFIDGPAAVRLEAPPPLERPLSIEADGAGVRPSDQGRTIAEAYPKGFHLEIPKPPTPDEAQVAAPCIVIGWPLGQEGRKHYSATAMFDRSGTCCATARATWLEVATMPT